MIRVRKQISEIQGLLASRPITLTGFMYKELTILVHPNSPRREWISASSSLLTFRRAASWSHSKPDHGYH